MFHRHTRCGVSTSTLTISWACACGRCSCWTRSICWSSTHQKMLWLYRSKTPTPSRLSSWCTTWKQRKCWVSMKTLPRSWPLCLKHSVICSAMLHCTTRWVGGVGDVVRCWCSLVKCKQHACLLRISAWKQKVLLLYKNDEKGTLFFCIKMITKSTFV